MRRNGIKTLPHIHDSCVQFIRTTTASLVETSAWWVYDQQPLGPRFPTGLWYSGLADTEVWQVPLPDDLAPGKYTVFTGLYRRSDLKRVPAYDAEGTPWLDARVPLGIISIGR